MLWFGCRVYKKGIDTAKNLKTSYVMVRRVDAVNNSSTPPHLKTSYVMVRRVFDCLLCDIIAFKNILCYGSAKARFNMSEGKINLKTSYVMVRLSQWMVEEVWHTSFKNILCYGSADTVICLNLKKRI